MDWNKLGKLYEAWHAQLGFGTRKMSLVDDPETGKPGAFVLLECFVRHRGQPVTLSYSYPTIQVVAATDPGELGYLAAQRMRANLKEVSKHQGD